MKITENHKTKFFFIKKTSLFFLLFVLFSPALFAQFYNGSQLTFGKNRVQYGERFWSFYRFGQFDTYFYQGGKSLAEYTAKYATLQIKEIEKKLDFNLEEKIQFLIYNKLSDLKQSNIGLVSEEQYNIGGITYINGSKIFLYFDGSHENFEQQIRAGIINIILNQMLYGSRITSIVKNSTLLALPEWYTQGLISYVSTGWNTEIDNKVKDGILSGRYKKYNMLTGTDALYAGHSIWKFIADKYGERSIPNVIYMTKISRNVENGFLFVMGISYKNLINEWIQYYTEMYDENLFTRTQPPSDIIQKKIKAKKVYSKIKLSPDGKYTAYTTNEIGKYKVYLFDNETKKVKKIIKSGYKLEEKTDYSYPLLAWHPSGKVLSIIFEAKGKIFLYHYMLETKKFDKSQLFNIEKILDFSYNHNGSKFALSAVQKGQSDIFVYHLNANTYERITKDIYDDLCPRFINSSQEIVFSSNRVNDTLRFDIETHKRKTSDSIKVKTNKDIFLYKYKQKNPVLRRITNTPFANETQPQEYENQYISYLSDLSGIQNRFIARFDSAISYIDTTTHYKYFSSSFPVTNFSRSIIEQDISPKAGKYAEIIYSDGLYKMYVNELVSAGELSSVELETTQYAEQLERILKDIETDTLSQKIPKQEKRTKRKKIVTVWDEEEITDSTNIDIDNYSFGTPKKTGKESYSDTLNQNKDNIAFAEFTFPKQRNYDVEYSINVLVSQVDFSFLNSDYQSFTGGGAPIFINPGFNFLIKIGVNDILEDYRITGGVRLAISFDNSEYILSYENLIKRLDKQIVFHRKSIQNIQDYSIIKHNSYELLYILKWPFNNVMALKGTILGRNDRAVNLSTDIQNLQEPNVYKTWAGLKAEFVFDNTRYKGLNLYYGTRYKIFGEYYRLIDNIKNELFVVGLDYRHYQKIHKTFIWANRFAASSSFGNNKLIYYMGGVDNWLIPKFDQSINIATDQNYTYQTLATNMRGFQQNIRNGNSFAVINSELRFPVFKYFSNKPVKSEFLNNFQIVGFADVGTAWTGPDPYSKENSLYTRIINQYPITVTVQTQREPIVYGYGVGLRSRLLGYFIRVDWAWGVEDGVVNPSIFYISLSLDF